MVDYRSENKYILSYSEKFINDFALDHESFVYGKRKYIKDYYLTNRPQLYSVKVGSAVIRFHKIDIGENNQSAQKSKRVIVFFILNSPKGKNTIFPAFCFSTQEEKTYNSKLKNPDFVKSLRLKLEKYNTSNENNIAL